MESIDIISPNTLDVFSKNRRNHIREIRKDVKVIIKRNFLSTDPSSSFLSDISTHGIAICCRKLFTEKNLVRLNLIFDDNVNFLLKGEIKYMQKKEILHARSGKKICYYQYGIKFIDQPPEFSKHLLETSLKKKLAP